MDLAKLIDFLHLYPSWFRSLVAIWIIGGAGLAAGLVLLKGDPAKPASQSTQIAPQKSGSTPPQASVPASVEPPIHPSAAQSGNLKILSATPEEYAIRLRSLSDRFLEKQEFIELHHNANVSWEGRVDRVSQHTQSKTLSLWMNAGAGDSEISVLVALPEDMRTKAFSLQRNDIVRVTGKLTLDTPNIPDLAAQELILMRPRGGG